jgi:hypothetical protein
VPPPCPAVARTLGAPHRRCHEQGCTRPQTLADPIACSATRCRRGAAPPAQRSTTAVVAAAAHPAHPTTQANLWDAQETTRTRAEAAACTTAGGGQPHVAWTPQVATPRGAGQQAKHHTAPLSHTPTAITAGIALWAALASRWPAAVSSRHAMHMHMRSWRGGGPQQQPGQLQVWDPPLLVTCCCIAVCLTPSAAPIPVGSSNRRRAQLTSRPLAHPPLLAAREAMRQGITRRQQMRAKAKLQQDGHATAPAGLRGSPSQQGSLAYAHAASHVQH